MEVLNALAISKVCTLEGSKQSSDGVGCLCWSQPAHSVSISPFTWRLTGELGRVWQLVFGGIFLHAMAILGVYAVYFNSASDTAV
jgi:hypothetical protein